MPRPLQYPEVATVRLPRGTLAAARLSVGDLRHVGDGGALRRLVLRGLALSQLIGDLPADSSWITTEMMDEIRSEQANITGRPALVNVPGKEAP